MKDLFFSIIICCYNSEKYIDETIKSIIDLNYQHWELIIIDDGSIDSTKNIVNKYLKNNKIKYYYQTNKGFAAARNLAVSKSTYDWIVIIDHDDLCLPERLDIHKQQILENQNAKLFFGNTIHFNKDGFLNYFFDKFNTNHINLSKGNVTNSLLKIGCFIDSESVVFNKFSALEINCFDESYKYLADYEFFCRMGEKFEFSYTLKPVSKWRIHENQATKLMDEIYKRELIKFYKKYFIRISDIKIKLFILIKLSKLYVRYWIKLIK